MLIVVDVESDGPAPGIHSMISFGAVVVEPGLKRKFKGFCAPITDQWIPEALAISKITREEHEAYPHPGITIFEFQRWILEQLQGERARMISDCIPYDFAFVNFYMWRYCGANPFGFNGRQLPDLYAGTQNNASATQGWKKFRKTKHTHDPVDDAMGMAEALLEMKKRGLRFDMIPNEPGA